MANMPRPHPAGYAGRPADLPPDAEPAVVQELRRPSCGRAVFAWPPRAGTVVCRLSCPNCQPVHPRDLVAGRKGVWK